jgi:hypothetical protein
VLSYPIFDTPGECRILDERRVTLVRTNVPEERIASIIKVARIGELGTTLTVSNRSTVFLRSALRLFVIVNIAPSSPILVTLMEIRSAETSVLI